MRKRTAIVVSVMTRGRSTAEGGLLRTRTAIFVDDGDGDEFDSQLVLRGREFDPCITDGDGQRRREASWGQERPLLPVTTREGQRQREALRTRTGDD